MVDKMMKYSFILLTSEKEGFLEKIQELGVVDITRSEKPIDQDSSHMFEGAARARKILETLEGINYAEDPDAEAIAAVTVEIKEDMTCTAEEIYAFCEAMPRYKRPKQIIFDKIPRNPTGKIEKPVLREKYCHGRLVENQITG